MRVSEKANARCLLLFQYAQEQCFPWQSCVSLHTLLDKWNFGVSVAAFSTKTSFCDTLIGFLGMQCDARLHLQDVQQSMDITLHCRWIPFLARMTSASALLSEHGITSFCVFVDVLVLHEEFGSLYNIANATLHQLSFVLDPDTSAAVHAFITS